MKPDLDNARLVPWSGLIAAPLGWAMHQQVIADALHFDCHVGDGFAAPAAGVALIVVIAAAGWLSWRGATQAVSPARRFVGQLGALAAAVFSFAIGLQALASFLLPGCGP